MELTDILPIEKWTEMEKDIHEMFDVDTNVFNVEGFRITDYKEWVNRLCPAIKADDRGQSFICAVAHMNISGMARQSKKPAIEECDAGLMKLVVPIFVKGEFVGAVGACGVLMDDNDVDSFMINRTIEMDEERIEALSDDIKRITTDKAEGLARYVSGRIDKIVCDYEALHA
jgi:ligand-binding sensor protein